MALIRINKGTNNEITFNECEISTIKKIKQDFISQESKRVSYVIYMTDGTPIKLSEDQYNNFSNSYIQDI